MIYSVAVSRSLLALLTLALAFAAAPHAQTHRFDLVVYGGTAGGVMTAVSAAREGLTVALVEPGTHLGGMVSGGLGWTDFGKKDVIGGYSALEFGERAREEVRQAARAGPRAPCRRGDPARDGA